MKAFPPFGLAERENEADFQLYISRFAILFCLSKYLSVYCMRISHDEKDKGMSSKYTVE